MNGRDVKDVGPWVLYVEPLWRTARPSLRVRARSNGDQGRTRAACRDRVDADLGEAMAATRHPTTCDM